MEVEVKQEDAEGNIVFEGRLTPQQHDFILSVGINYLLAKGALPFLSPDEDVQLAPGSDELQ